MAEHTKEPWAIHTEQEFSISRATSVYICRAEEPWPSGQLARVNVQDGFEEREANARRIVDCVNALAGIPDPAAFVQAARGMREALESIAEYWNRDRNDMAMHNACWHAVNTAEDALTSFRAAMGEGQSDA